MKDNNTFYITTPIYYPSDKLHTTVFGLFERAEDAAQAWEELRGTYRDTFLTETL